MARKLEPHQDFTEAFNELERRVAAAIGHVALIEHRISIREIHPDTDQKIQTDTE